MRRFAAVLVVALALTVLAGFAPPASAATVTYTQPVAGEVVDGFRPPSTPYGRGNRGLTYETAEGSPARASAPGRVTFAGQVGGALHVVVQHSDGVRTSYAFLRSIRVRNGQRVEQGDVIGSTGESFHFGARIGDAYVDPAILLQSGPARVHLIADDEFGKDDGSDRAWLAGIVVDTFVAVSRDAYRWVREAGDAVNDAAHAAARHAAEQFLTRLDDIVDLGEYAGPFAQLASALATIAESFLMPCTDKQVAPPTPPERRIAVFVAGLGSSWKGRGGNLSSRILRNGDMGYEKGDVYDFSYRGGRNPQPYEAKDTVGSLRDRASELRDLLDRIATENPGVPVDVIAHSQGGLIAREAMAHDYDGAAHRMPDVQHVITLGTPHHGTDAATTQAWLRWTPGGRAIRAVAKRMHSSFDLTGPGIGQLSETSDFIRDINDRPLREGVRFTSVAGALDLVVPAPRARLRGAANTVLDVRDGAFGTHSALVDSDAGRREVALAIADLPPTCQAVLTAADRALMGVTVATAEDALGKAVVSKTAP